MRDIDGKIAILYGLHRTGKTTLLFHRIAELPIDQTVYIKIRTTDNVLKLKKDPDLMEDIKYQLNYQIHRPLNAYKFFCEGFS